MLSRFAATAVLLLTGSAAAWAGPAWVPLAFMKEGYTQVSNSLCYSDGDSGLICDGSAAVPGSAVSVTTGTSGSIVYRDQNGRLVASSGVLISSTTGSISATSVYAGSFGTSGSLVYRDSNGLLTGTSNVSYTPSTGAIRAPYFQAGAVGAFQFDSSGNNAISGNANSTAQYLALTTSGTEALRIVSTGYVGIGTTAPSRTLYVSGTGTFTNSLAIGSGNAPAGEFTISTATGRRMDVLLAYSTMDFYSNGGSQGTFAFNRYSNATNLLFMPDGTGKVGINIAYNANIPSTSLHVSGTLRIADGGEACDSNRAGAIKYAAGTFSFCNGSAWQSLATVAAAGAPTPDRIVSASANVVAGNGGTISFTTGGVSGTAYIDTVGRFVAAGVSTTGTVSAVTVAAGNVAATGSVSATRVRGNTVQLAGDLADPCTSENAGMIRFVGNRMFVCKDPALAP